MNTEDIPIVGQVIEGSIVQRRLVKIERLCKKIGEFDFTIPQHSI